LKEITFLTFDWPTRGGLLKPCENTMSLKQWTISNGGKMSDLFGIPPDLLDPNPDNIRLDTPELREHVRTIANSIIGQGFLRSRPLTIRLIGERALVVDGNCRLAAIRLAIAEGAEIKDVPCVSEPRGTDDADRVCNMLLANSGLAHTPLEYTTAVKRLLSYGWTDADVAKKLGKSRAWVANLLDLAEAPPEVRAAVADGSVSSTLAVKLVREHGAGAAAVVAEAKAKTGRAHVTERHVRAPRPVAQSMESAARDLIAVWDANGDYAAAIEALRAALG
jgi:ParB-like chromosome segregation protein Spo0J